MTTKTIFHMADGDLQLKVDQHPSGAVDVTLARMGQLIMFKMLPEHATALGVALTSASFPHTPTQRPRGNMMAIPRGDTSMPAFEADECNCFHCRVKRGEAYDGR